MRYRKLLIALLIGNLALGMIACGNKTDNNTETTEIIETETELVVESIPWLQLGSLESHPELRAAFDEYFGITGETGNKVGPIYYNTDTEQADQNVTLFMVLKNTDTRGHFIAVDSRDKIANMAIEYYSMDIGDQAATYAAINAYFNLLPDEALKEGEEPTFDNGKISRAAAMALLMRATTQVNDSQTPDANSVFTSAVGSGQFTDFAAPMNVFAYYHTDLSKETGSSTTNLMTKEDFDAYVKANKGEAVLNEDLFNTSMTKGEFIYMVTNYLLSDYQAKLDEEGFVDIYENAPEVELTIVTDGGDITLEDAMAGAANDASTGIPSDMYAVFKQAVKYNLISEDVFAEWNATVSKSDAVELFTTMALNYTEESAYGLYNDGYKNPEDTSDVVLGAENNETALYGMNLPGDGNGMQKFQAWARSQGADWASGWTFVYMNGKGAGDQPTYGVYMKEGSRYGEIFHVGDILPDGSRLDGTREEEDAISTQNAKDKVEEAGGRIYIDEETGKEVWEIP